MPAQVGRPRRASDAGRRPERQRRRPAPANLRDVGRPDPRGTTTGGGSVVAVLAAAALVPDTALLVPGAAGAAEVLAPERAAAEGVVAAMLRGVARVVVVPPGRDAVATPDGPGPWRPTLDAAGIDDDALGWGADGVAGARTVRDVPAAVGLLLLARLGWTGPTHLLVPRPGERGDAAALAERGRSAVAGPEPVGMLLVGSLSARRGLHGPAPHDERAAEVDRALVADLAGLGAPETGVEARDRLRAFSPGLAAELATSVWAPLQVLLGAHDGERPGPARVASVTAPLGATYAVIGWTPDPLQAAP